MRVSDEIYGTTEIGEAVLVDLINSPSLQRLKGISQHGYPKETETELPHYSRFEHSIGVMLLLRRLGASLDEQVAGLVHDVSHTAFSHIVDWIFGDPTKEDFQDKVLEGKILQSELKEIIERHGFDVKEISGLEHNGHYRLLETDAPDLCADRLDYALRDSHLFLGVDVSQCVADLTVHDNEIVFKARSAAREFGNWYMRCQRDFWACNEARLRYYLIAEALKSALDHKVLNHDDLYLTEDEVIAKIRQSQDGDAISKLETGLGRLRFITSDKGNIELTKKLRYVDPKFMDNGTPVRLSEVNPEFAMLIKEEKERSRNAVRVELLGKK